MNKQRLAAFVLGWTVLAAGPSRASDQKLAGVWMEGNRLTLRVQQDADIRPALRQLLKDHSHVMIDRGTANSLRHIDVILLSSAGPHSRPQLGAIEVTDGGENLRGESEPVEQLVGTALSSAPAGERGSAAEAIAYRAGSADGAPAYASQVLEQMLSDPDEDVRARVLETLKDTADRVPFEALSQVAREDVSAARRIQALELLVERSENGEAHEALRIALNDPDAAVRERARELVLDWHIALDGA